MKIGIDQMAFATTDKYIDMTELAIARHVEPNKFLIGIGQVEQAVIPKTQNVVTLGASAASQIINETNRDTIDMVLFATESGIDNSKAAAIYVQKLLQINRYARTVEVKQACYGGTAALMFARDFVLAHPTKQVLVIAADVARYGLETPGEVTQGGGAVAMLVKANPQVLALNDDSVYMSTDIMDFWRPLYRTEALVDGHFSANIYQDFFKELWQRYQMQTALAISDFTAFAFHLPFTKMGLKGLLEILPTASESHKTALLTAFEASRVYNKRIGNLYTGSLYLSLMSLLDNQVFTGGERIGLFSYGSGAEGEFYSGTVQPTYQKGLKTDFKALFAKRERLAITTYEQIFNDHFVLAPDDVAYDLTNDSSQFVFAGIKNQQQQYHQR